MELSDSQQALNEYNDYLLNCFDLRRQIESLGAQMVRLRDEQELLKQRLAEAQNKQGEAYRRLEQALKAECDA